MVTGINLVENHWSRSYLINNTTRWNKTIFKCSLFHKKNIFENLEKSFRRTLANQVWRSLPTTPTHQNKTIAHYINHVSNKINIFCFPKSTHYVYSVIPTMLEPVIHSKWLTFITLDSPIRESTLETTHRRNHDNKQSRKFLQLCLGTSPHGLKAMMDLESLIKWLSIHLIGYQEITLLELALPSLII